MINSTMEKTDRGLGFFSAGCFLSNFFKCSVFYQGIMYKSVEHGYQGMKAKTCHAQGMYDKIMSTESAALTKIYAEDIFVTDEWEKITVKNMKDLLFCKFRQNQELYFKLINTRPHNLLECTVDEFWGTGCRLVL